MEEEDLLVVWGHGVDTGFEVFSFWVSFVWQHNHRPLPNHPNRDSLGRTCLSQGHPIGNVCSAWLDKQGNLQN